MIKIILAFAVITCFSCTERDKNGNILDTPTSGRISIAADESMKPLIDAQIKAFEGIYRYAHIDVYYTTEQRAMDMLMHDSVRLVIIGRKLQQEEKQVITSQKIVPTELKMAVSGIALIANRLTTDSIININDLKKLLSGDPTNAFSKVVFDEPGSGIINYLIDTLQLHQALGSNCFAVKGSQAVVSHVARVPGTLGLIDLCWISDSDDSTSNSFLDTIKVLAVAKDTVACQPYQAYVAQGKYPLSRDVMIISREARSGLGNGFMAFLASDKGQRIVLKAGLVPATMPIRIIEINHQPF
jgi:phosphate transport system substrate-binding protein